MTYCELKQTKMYTESGNVFVSVNGKEFIDEKDCQFKLDTLPVVGTGHMANGDLFVDLVCSNWNQRFDADWIKESKWRKFLRQLTNIIVKVADK